MPLVSADIAFGCLLASLLLTLAIIDSRRMILPDEVNALLAIGGLVASIVTGEPPLVEAIAAAAIGGCLLWSVAFGYRRWRDIEGLGFGDVKLFAAGAIWTGLQGQKLCSIRLPANRYARCNSSIRRISARAAAGTGRA